MWVYIWVYRIILCRYKKVQKRNSCVVQFTDGSYGEIKYYFVDKTEKVMAVVSPFIKQNPSFSCKKLEEFVFPVTKEERVILKEVTDISRKCVLIPLHQTYLCRIPNFIETD